MNMHLYANGCSECMSKGDHAFDSGKDAVPFAAFAVKKDARDLRCHANWLHVSVRGCRSILRVREE
jgi:hypothetical protein